MKNHLFKNYLNSTPNFACPPHR